MPKKRCGRCGEEKPIDEFYKTSRPGYKYGVFCQCKPCRRMSTRELKSRWGNAKRSSRNSGLMRRVGIGADEYDKMYENQRGLCGMCGDWAPRGGRGGLEIDHCHATKKVRMLLCGWCNKIIGHAKDNPSALMRGVLYLETFLSEELPGAVNA